MTDFLPIATEYYKSGLSVIPIGNDKLPMIKWSEHTKSAIQPNGNFKNAINIGIVCGVANVECIDIDCKYDLTGQLFDNYKREINEACPGLLQKMVVQSTKNKGYHFIYKCSVIEGNKKLANRYTTADEKELKPDENQKVLIETRGRGGYIMVAPSEGYKIIYGSLDAIKEITPNERQILFDCAHLFNEVREPLNDKYKLKNIQDLSPFDDFNDRGEIISVLENAGWKNCRTIGSKIRFLRPGGEGKWSAEYHTDLKIFYVWTSSTDFVNDKGYNHSQVLAYLKFNKDYSETAKYLISKGYGKSHKEYQKVKNQEPTPEHIKSFLESSYIDPSVKIDRPPTILSIREPSGTQSNYQRILTLGNFSVLKGKKKSRKTFLATLFSGELLKKSSIGDILLNELPEGKQDVAYFDTEQGKYDSYVTIQRILTIGDKSRTFRGYNLRPYSPMERCQIIEEYLKTYGQTTGFIVIDGIRDLVTAINDEPEATRVTGLYLRWTHDYNIHILTIIHENKADGNSRGHIGTEIENRAEIIISVSEIAESWTSSRVACDFCRGIKFKDFTLTIENNLPFIDAQFKKVTPSASWEQKEEPDTYSSSNEETPF